jgi:group II intron reverse transcriptase/maturase
MLAECYRELDGKKALGIDGITKEMYGAGLDENLDRLIAKIRKGAYRPQPARVVKIPKEDGSERPLAISCFEDKLVQLAVSKILGAIYEPLFLPGSYGFRPGRGAHDALKELNNEVYRNPRGAIIEIDLQKYFNSIPLKALEEMLEAKITDRRFLGLIGVLIRTPTFEDGVTRENSEGVPQGSILSPILANVYLHYVMDVWIEQITKGKHLKGRTKIIRYADDFVITCEYAHEAKALYEVIPKRLAKYGLKVNLCKSGLLIGGSETLRSNKLQKYRFKFLGFEYRWIKARKGFLRLALTPRLDRMNAFITRIKDFLRQNLAAKGHQKALLKVRQMMVGWINYFALSDCQRRVHSFILRIKRLLFWWFNRRGGRKRRNWQKLTQTLNLAGIPDNFRTKSLFSSLGKQTNFGTGA